MYIAKIFLSYFAKGLVHKRFETTRKKGRKKRRKKKTPGIATQRICKLY